MSYFLYSKSLSDLEKGVHEGDGVRDVEGDYGGRRAYGEKVREMYG